jgi:charged multivesicular body protein 6
MKNQRDKLRQYQKRITVITTRETEIAKECLAKGDKHKALLALRRKKYQESLLTKTDSQLEQLEKLTSSVEFALVQKDVYFGLQQGTEVLKMINLEMGGLEGVEKMMGETEEARRYQQEISEALAGQMSNEEEDEVEDELEALEREVEGVKMPNVPNNTVVSEDTLPEVPQTEVEREQERLQKQKDRAKQRRVALEAS